MAVRQQQPVEPAKASPASEQLTLCAFSAIDHDAVTTNFHEKPRMIALRRWDARRSSEKGQIKHAGVMISSDGMAGCPGATVLPNYMSTNMPPAFSSKEAIDPVATARLRTDRLLGGALFLFP
jgi:hypothetical protein